MGASNSSIGGVGVGSERVGTCECRRYLIERKDLSGRPTEKIDRPEPDASGMIGMTGVSLVPKLADRLCKLADISHSYAAFNDSVSTQQHSFEIQISFDQNPWSCANVDANGFQ